MTLSVVMVFCVTYMLILPAFTLEADKAKEQGGIDVPEAEQIVDDENDSSSETPEPADSNGSSAESSPEKPSSDGATSPSDSSGSKDNDKENNKDNNSDSSDTLDTKTESKAETNSETESKNETTGASSKDADNAKGTDSIKDSDNVKDTDKSKASASESGTDPLAHEGEGFTITVDDTSSVLPSETEVSVAEITADTDAKKYKKLYSQAEQAIQDDSKGKAAADFARFYDISLIAGGEEIEPDKAVSIIIDYDRKYRKELSVTDPEDIRIVHFTENKTTGKIEPEILDNDKINLQVETKDEKMTQTSFEAESFSVYGVVGTTLEKTVLSSDGHNYKITATYGADSKIPAGAELEVSEITEGASLNGTSYDEYAAKSEKALGLEEGSAGYIRLFDIKIVDKNDHSKKYQPADGSSVSVRIRLADSDSEDLRVVHFGDASENGEIVEAETNGKTVSFGANGFSVYAVVDGSTDEYARMKLTFYNGTTEIASVYVKNGDTLTELESIIYDPGAGELSQGEAFTGWILDKPNYTTADVSDALDISQVREWAEALRITEGDEHNLYASICKFYTITYKDTDGTVLGMDSVPVKASEYGTAEVSDIIKMAYTPKDDVHNFEGWTLDEGSIGNVTSTIPADRIYQNDTSITIKGDISFTVNAPAGNWLVFDENGKGGTYNAPQFIKSGEVTSDSDLNTMTRNGYTFGDWYDTKEHADAHGQNPSVTTGRFNFGSELTEKTTVYASWIPNTTAPYTVILWTQNVDRTAYEVAGSYVGTGRVGNNIPYTFVNNGDEDYVTGVGNGNGHYKGFSLVAADSNQQITITPEGDAVLNLHYDRIKYNFKFYLYRRSGNGNTPYTYANNSGSGETLDNLVTWHTASRNHPGVANGSGYTIKSETHRFNNINYTYYYFDIEAYYGEDISSLWPTYDSITGADGREAVSFVMMVGTKLKPRATSSGSGTVKGIITVWDENILGATNDSNGNYVIVRFPGSYNNWRYHIWFETVDGEDYTGKTTRTYNGKTYYEDDVLVVRSSNTEVSSQNDPKYQGFTFKEKRGQNWNNSNYWTTGSNPTLYHLNFVYDRDKYNISYFDGAYVDGNGQQIQNRATHLLHESGDISHGAVIPSSDRNYEPELPEGEEGYVFEGWYLDEACTIPYPWGKMPVGGIKVYAKWRQVQYRVILHPNAGNDPNLEWGSESVSTSFRVSYGSKISTPTGKRPNSGYEFVGWYTDPSMSSEYLYVADTVLNDETVTKPYDQTDNTELDKWGNVTEGNEGYNSDAANNRTWITKKLELYAKWRKILEGSEGIRVIYTADDGKGNVGSNAPEDPSLYPDMADATAQAADTAPEGVHFKHWVIQKWDEAQNKYVDTEMTVLPGQQFTVSEEYAHKSPVEGDPGMYSYTMQLRAEYSTPESELPTHIWWFDNYSSTNEARHDSSHQDVDIQVNEAVDIQPPRERDGYKFLGWARVAMTQSESEDGTPPTGKVLTLGQMTFT